MNSIKLHKYTIAISLILLFAAWIRLYNISGYMTFLGDEGRDALVAYNILHGHLTLLGPNSSVGGFFLGPVYYYFMAPFLFIFNYDPVGPAVMIALFSLLTVFLLYKIGKEFFGPIAGLIAALLYSVSPLVVHYSQSSWNPNMMPISTLLFFYFLYKGVEKSNWKYFLACGFIFGLILQFHYLGTFVGVIGAAYLLVIFLFYNKGQLSKKLLQLVQSYIILFIGFIIGFSPFIAFEARHGFQNIKNIFTFVFHSKDTGAGGHFLPTVWDIFFRTFGRIVTAFPIPGDFHLYNPMVLTFWQVLTIILAIISVIALFKIKNKLWMLLLLFWFFGGVLLFGFYKKPIYDYYLEFLFPLPFLLVGNAGTVIIDHFKKKHLGLLGVLAGVVLLFWVNYQYANPWHLYPNFQKDQAKIIADFVLSKTNNQPFNFALITSGNSDFAYRYYMTIQGHPPITILPPFADPQRKSVTNQLFIVCESLPCHPLGWSLFEVAGFGQADITGQWNVSVVDIYKLVHHKGK